MEQTKHVNRQIQIERPVAYKATAKDKARKGSLQVHKCGRDCHLINRPTFSSEIVLSSDKKKLFTLSMKCYFQLISKIIQVSLNCINRILDKLLYSFYSSPLPINSIRLIFLMNTFFFIRVYYKLNIKKIHETQRFSITYETKY